MHFMKFPATLVQLVEKPTPTPTPPLLAKQEENIFSGSIHFMEIPVTLVQVAEKPAHPQFFESGVYDVETFSKVVFGGKYVTIYCWCPGVPTR